ncbi:MAG: hypothetical protein Q9M97_09480 [Candidatus Gracilibacteria bacterium]|nr:hypothetical protein [Candidatus Gracilibacteria bacterium]
MNNSKSDLTNLKIDVEEGKNELNIDELEKILTENYEITDIVDELNDDIKDLSNIQNKLSGYENYEEFINMVTGLNDEKLEDKVFSLFSELSTRQINKINRKYKGMPINKEQLNYMLGKIRNNNLDLLGEIDEVEKINIDILDDLGELDYIIDKTNDLLNSNGLSSKDKSILSNRKIDFITKEGFILEENKNNENKNGKQKDKIIETKKSEKDKIIETKKSTNKSMTDKMTK